MNSRCYFYELSSLNIKKYQNKRTKKKTQKKEKAHENQDNLADQKYLFKNKIIKEIQRTSRKISPFLRVMDKKCL